MERIKMLRFRLKFREIERPDLFVFYEKKGIT